MTSEQVVNHEIAAETYIVPVIGKLSAEEYEKLQAIIQDLKLRNISMRYKYIARLFHGGMLEKMVNLFKGSDKIRKRKRSENESLSNVKRQATDHLEQISSNTIHIHGVVHSGSRNSTDPEAATQAMRTEGESNTKQQNDHDESTEVFTQEPYAPPDRKRSNYELAKYTRRQATTQTDTFTDVNEKLDTKQFTMAQTNTA